MTFETLINQALRNEIILCQGRDLDNIEITNEMLYDKETAKKAQQNSHVANFYNLCSDIKLRELTEKFFDLLFVQPFIAFLR